MSSRRKEGESEVTHRRGKFHLERRRRRRERRKERRGRRKIYIPKGAGGGGEEEEEEEEVNMERRRAKGSTFFSSSSFFTFTFSFSFEVAFTTPTNSILYPTGPSISWKRGKKDLMSYEGGQENGNWEREQGLERERRRRRRGNCSFG